MKVTVLGAGAWGTAIAVALARRHNVTLWGRSPRLLDRMRAERCNGRYLPGLPLPPRGLALEADIAAALRSAEAVLAAVPTDGLREVLRSVHGNRWNGPLAWLCKGFESGSAMLPHEICRQELGPTASCAALSGPSFAAEVGSGLPTALTLAAIDGGVARTIAGALHGDTLRIYSSDDVIGVEVGGAVKNVMAIAAGISDGLKLGANARAALITRGLAEIVRLGLALGGRRETFMGLAGLGDLVLTCTSDLSRNRRVGLALASGTPVSEVLAGLGHVAEGVGTARVLAGLAARHNVVMPITEAVRQVLENPSSAQRAVVELLGREQKSEY